MVMPVRSIATGDIQLPAAVTAELRKPGTGIASRPITMPRSVQASMGFLKLFSRWRKVGFSVPSPRSRTGTPQR